MENAHRLRSASWRGLGNGSVILKTFLKILTIFIAVGAVGGAVMMWMDPTGVSWGGEPMLDMLRSKMPWDQSQKWRRTQRFLPPLEMRPSSIAPNPVESREGPPNSRVSLTSQRHTEKLPEATGTSRGNPGFTAVTQETP